MAAKFVVLIAFVALASAGRLARDAASPLDDLQKHAAEFQKTITQEYQALNISTHTEEFHKALKDGSNAVLKHLSDLNNNLQSALADSNAKTRQVLEAGQQQVSRAVQELQRNHQDVHENAEKLKASLSNAVASAVEATKTLAKEVGTKVEATNEKLAPQIKSAYDDFVKQVQEVTQNLKAASSKQ